MSTFNTIHIFGFGNTQIIKENLNKSVKSADLTTLAAFVDSIKAQKPEDVVEAEYHVIHIFSGNSVRYLGAGNVTPNVKNSFNVEWANVDATLLDALVADIEAHLPVETPAE